MKMRGRLKSVAREWSTNMIEITFEASEININEIDGIKDKDLQIEAKQFRNKRSGAANRLLWECIGQITEHLRQEAKDPTIDKWDIYLGYIKRFGQCEMIRIMPDRFSKLQQTWRELEIIGHPIINGVEMYDVLCYYGSSTYDSREFSMLLSDVIEDMKQMNIPTPTSQEMKRAIAEIEKEEL